MAINKTQREGGGVGEPKMLGALLAPWTDLRNDGEFGAEVVQADLGDPHFIDGDVARCRFQQTEQAECHGGLASASPSHNANLS